MTQKAIWVYLWVSLAALSLGFALGLASPYSDYKKLNGTTDFIAFLVGGNIAASGNISNLYDLTHQTAVQNQLLEPVSLNGVLAFINPPVTAYFYAPLANLSMTSAFWAVVSVNTFLIAISLVLLLMNTNLDYRIAGLYIVLIPWHFSFWHTLIGGQPAGVILFLLTLSYVFLKKGNYFISGVLIGFLFIKPQFLLIALLLAFSIHNIKSRKSFIFGAALSVLFMCVVNSLLYGWDFLPDYISLLFFTDSSNYGTSIKFNFNLVSVMSFFTQSNSHAKTASMLLITPIYLYVTKRLNKLNINTNISHLFSIAVFFTPILNLHTMNTDLLVYLIPLFLWSRTCVVKNYVAAETLIFIMVFLVPWLALYSLQWMLTLVLLGFGFYLLLGSCSSGRVNNGV